MRIWLPELPTKGGASVYTQRLNKVLQLLGHEVEVTQLSILHQGFPYFLKLQKPLKRPDVVIADIYSGAMLKDKVTPLVVIEHHCVFDPAYLPYRTSIQATVHELLWRKYERNSLKAADAVVCVSNYTASSVQSVFGNLPVHVIPNAIDTEIFCPGITHADELNTEKKKKFKLLHVGNLTKRKGVDLLPKIMSKLGPDFELHYTSGLRTSDILLKIPNAKSLGRLNDRELLDEYRKADVLLFPTRFEGFGFAAAEAMACGTPVVTTNCSSLPELVDDRINGVLCPIDNVEAFVNAINDLANNPKRLMILGQNAREKAVSSFHMGKMAKGYSEVLKNLV